jgi:hypothetical protein
MRSRDASSLLVLLVLGGAAAFAACGGSSNGGGGGGGGDAGLDGADATSDASDGGDDTSFIDHGNVVSIAVTPGSATVTVTNGSSTPVGFVAMATYEDGSTAPIGATWSLDRPDLGSVDGGGSFSASGTLGGAAVLTATSGSLKSTAKIDVKLRIEQDGPGVAISTADKVNFDFPDATASGTLVYPYDKTVFPRGLLPPEIMWNGGAAGDVYRVRTKEKYVDAAFYVKADPPGRFTMPAAVWNELGQSNAGEDVTVEITRMTGTQAHAPMTQTWTIARGSLRGSIYYWAVNTGQLMKIAPGASSPTVVFDSGSASDLGTPAPSSYNGTVPPWEPAEGNKRCVACHTVSKDGSTLAAVFEKKGSTASPWGTLDLTKSAPSVTQMTPYTSSTIYLGLTPDGAYAVANDVNMTMHLANAKTGATMPSLLDGFADKTCDPVFSPDGKQLAFSSHVGGYYPVEFYQADLDVADYDPTAHAFSNRRTIAPGGGKAIAFASFSPDSKWVFYQKGDYSRAKYGASGELTGHNDLYVTDVAGTVGEIKLSTASGVSLETHNQQRSYQPTVNPVSVGGYTWVVFFSPRDYGNRMVSSTDATTQNRKQLWVAAVDSSPTAGKDPSHPAFWLPGQDLTTTNMSGYWALEPCRGNGTSCDQGFECCTGFCRPDGSGKLTCSAPSSSCSAIGEKCGGDGDCCDSPSARCIGGFCAYAQPG